jgi:hypothetical protein
MGGNEAMRKIVVPLVALTFTAMVLSVQAGDTKAIKSDVSVKQDDKSAKAKIGEIVEIKIDNPPTGPTNAVTDVKVTIEANKVLTDKHDERDTVGTTPDGKTLVGSGFKSVYVYPATEGKAKVTVEFKKGGKPQKHEYMIEVKGKK